MLPGFYLDVAILGLSRGGEFWEPPVISYPGSGDDEYMWTTQDFSPSLSFDGRRRHAQHAVSGGIAFSAVSAGAQTFGENYIRLVADGSHVPTFAAPLVEHDSSGGYDNRPGAVNLLNAWFDGYTYFYSWSHEMSQVIGAIPVRFRSLTRMTESGNAMEGYAYDSTAATGWGQVAVDPSLYLPANTDGSVEAKWQGGSFMLAFADTNNINDYWQQATFAIWNDTGDSNKIKVYSEAGGIADASGTAHFATAPEWFRLRRVGSTIYAEYSADDRATWTALHSFSSATGILYPSILSSNASGLIGPVFGRGLAAAV